MGVGRGQGGWNSKLETVWKISVQRSGISYLTQALSHHPAGSDMLLEALVTKCKLDGAGMIQEPQNQSIGCQMDI